MAENWCRSDDLELEECAPSEDSEQNEATDDEPYVVARALHEAMIAIVGLEGHKDGDVDWGIPRIDAECCCGQMATGIVLPESYGESPGYTMADYRWVVVATWDKEKSSVSTVSRESRRLIRKIVDVACCKLKAQGYKMINLDIETSSNFKADDTECANTTITLKQ